jgi:hypothetical protein
MSSTSTRCGSAVVLYSTVHIVCHQLAEGDVCECRTHTHVRGQGKAPVHRCLPTTYASSWSQRDYPLRHKLHSKVLAGQGFVVMSCTEVPPTPLDATHSHLVDLIQ